MRSTASTTDSTKTSSNRFNRKTGSAPPRSSTSVTGGERLEVDANSPRPDDERRLDLRPGGPTCSSNLATSTGRNTP